MRRGWKENIADFLLVVSPWGDGKIRHSHVQDLPSTGPGTGLGLVGEGAGRLHSTPPVICPSYCSDSPTSPVTPPPLPRPLPAPTFLILTIIKRPRVLWDPLILFAILYWRN